MASNPFSDAILRSLSSTAQVNAAKSGTGGLGTILAQALGAALPNSPLFRGIAAGNQAYNVGQYNKALTQSAAQKAAYDNAMNAAKAQDRAAIGQQVGLRGYGGYLDLPDASTIGLAQDQNQNPAMNDFLGGGPLRIAQGGKVTPEVIKQYMERIGQNADSQTTMSLLEHFMGPNAFGGEGAKVQTPGGTAQMDTTGPLTASAQASNLFDQNPYGLGIPDLAQLGILRKNEQGDRLGNRNATESERSDKAKEADNAAQTAIKRAIYNATKNNQGGYGRNPAAPHSPTEADRAWQMYQAGQMSQEDYIRSLGGKASGSGASSQANDPILKGLQADLQATAKKYGSQSSRTLKAANAVDSYKAGQAFKNTPTPSVSQLYPNMNNPLFGGGTPFGGQSGQKLKQGAENLSKSIYPGRG